MVENYRPDVKARLGIGYEALRAINKRIILASISGFGEDRAVPHARRLRPDRAGHGRPDVGNRAPGQGPMRAGAAIADSSAGLYAAIGILVALAERERSGEGQWVTTSLLAAQIAMMDFQAARYLVDGEVPPQAGNDHPYVTPTGAFETADGFINIGLGGPKQWKVFCKTLGRPDLAEHPDYATQNLRFKHRPALNAELAKAFKTRTSKDWSERLEAVGVPAGPIYHMDEVFADPQVQHLGMAAPVHHPERGDIRIVAEPVALSRTPADITTPIAELGEHTDAVLAELGYGPAEIEKLRQQHIV